MSVALHQLKSAITRILYEKKRIDLVVNNAGYALVGPFEDSSMDEIKAQVEPNFFGPVRVVNGILLSCSDGCCKNYLNRVFAFSCVNCVYLTDRHNEGTY